MSEHSLSDTDVARLIDRQPEYVAKLRRGDHPVTAAALRLLELELEHGHGRSLIQSRAAG